jgi:hypothetical protein
VNIVGAPPGVTGIAMKGSNAQSLMEPKNSAGASLPYVAAMLKLIGFGRVFLEYVLSTLDKVANWARQGSMWPMTFGAWVCVSSGDMSH